MGDIMLIDPKVNKFFGHRVLIEHHPAYTPHRSGGLKVLFPGFVTSKILGKLFDEPLTFLRRGFSPRFSK